MKQGIAGALAVMMVASGSCAAGASPLMTAPSPSDFISPRNSLLHRVLIYAKEGSKKLLDGRWNLGQAQSKLGIALSPEQAKQLMACTGRIVCQQPWGEVFGSAASVLRPDLLVTAKHVFSKVRGGPVSFAGCSFRSHAQRKRAIPVLVEKDQRRGYFLNNEDFIVVRLKRELEGCRPFAVNESDRSLSEGDEVLSVTGHQRRTLNKISDREPVLAKGTIRGAYDAVLGGAPFYYADIDLDEGGSGGAVFALKDGRPVADGEGRLTLRGILVAHGPRAKSGQPYSEERNYTIVIGLQSKFRDLVEGKGREPVAVQAAPCLEDGAAKIAVIASVPPAQPEPLASLLRQKACGRDAAADDECIAKELQELTKTIATLAASGRGKEKQEFRLRNDTGCPVCFTYRSCNDYGCWDEAAMASAKSTLFAGVGELAPAIENPHFCRLAGVPAFVHPPLPSRTPGRSLSGRTVAEAPAEARFMAAKEKAKRAGVWTLTEEDIRGLSLDQIRALRGY